MEEVAGDIGEMDALPNRELVRNEGECLLIYSNTRHTKIAGSCIAIPINGIRQSEWAP